MTHLTPETLALHWSRDLPSAESATVSRHLDICPECRRSFAELEISQQLLHSAWLEPSAADLADLRQRVLANLHRPSPKWPFAAFAAAAAASVLFLARLYTPLPPPPLPRLPIAWNAPALTPMRVSSPRALNVVARKPRPAPKPGIRSASFIAQADAPPILKLTTADPDVIILLPPPATQSHESSQPNE